jgi:hypothetical protein
VRADELCSADLVAGGRRNPPRVPVLTTGDRAA